ncbi:MAG: hypothetical protein HY731_11410 [Candidatus Tectomicrobia bacterium]|nr:hypothetical protein [Candidatus Tectomicrobia bacterium]
MAQFDFALRCSDPDVILFSRELSSYATNVVNLFPSSQRLLTDHEIERHNEGVEWIQLKELGTIPHISFLLYRELQEPLRQNRIRICDSAGPYAFETALYFGAPCVAYRTFLTERLAAKVLRPPADIIELIKLAAESTAWMTPLTATRHAIKQDLTWKLSPGADTFVMGIRQGRYETLFLYLDDGISLDIPVAFWNARRIPTQENKILLNRSDFLAGIDGVLDLLARSTRFDEILVITPANREEAVILLDCVQRALENAHWSVPVAVQFRNFGYDLVKLDGFWGVRESATRSVGSDLSVRFRPSMPIGHEEPRMVFGFDCDVGFSTGTKLSLPSIPFTSRLLLNDSDRLRWAKENYRGFGELWLQRGMRLRARPEGIAGVLKPGEECCFYLHEDEVWIGELLAGLGVHVVPNQHTRYAKGFVAKFGGIGETLSLIREGGAHLLEALDAHRAEQAGFSFQQIHSFLIKQRGLTKDQADHLVQRRLPELLAAGLVRRGVALKCPQCELVDWYAIDSLAEFVHCTGCGDPFQLETEKLSYHYIPNELARRFIKAGGQAVLMTADVLRKIDPSALIQFGGNLHRIGDKKNFAEVDLILLSNLECVFAECKDYDQLDTTDRIDTVIQSLQNMIKSIADLNPDRVVLGVTTRSENPSLHQPVKEVADNAARMGIEVDLVLNGELFLRGTRHIDLQQSSVVRITRRPLNEEDRTVGELRNKIGLGSIAGSFNRGLLEQWAEEMLE